MSSTPSPSWPGLSRPSTSCWSHARKTWMPGTSPGTTKQHAALAGVAAIFLVEKSLCLHRQMHLVLERRIAAGRQKARIVGDRLAQRRHPGAVVLGEIGQDIAVHQLLDAGVTDPEPDAAIVVADMRGDRAQPVMAGNAAADLDAQLRRRQLKLVLEHGDLASAELEEVRGFLHRAPVIVHERRGLQQDHPLAIQRAFGGLALKAAAPWCKPMTPRDLVDGHKADIVPVTRVFRAGIAEANKKSHDAASRVRLTLLLLVAATSGRLRTRCRRRTCRRRGSTCRWCSSTCRRSRTGSRSACRGCSRRRLLLFGVA